MENNNDSIALTFFCLFFELNIQYWGSLYLKNTFSLVEFSRDLLSSLFTLINPLFLLLYTSL